MRAHIMLCIHAAPMSMAVDRTLHHFSHPQSQYKAPDCRRGAREDLPHPHSALWAGGTDQRRGVGMLSREHMWVVRVCAYARRYTWRGGSCWEAARPPTPRCTTGAPQRITTRGACPAGAPRRPWNGSYGPRTMAGVRLPHVSPGTRGSPRPSCGGSRHAGNRPPGHRLCHLASPSLHQARGRRCSDGC